jgi:glycosyltransferase involved in cell wall biosynthesis
MAMKTISVVTGCFNEEGNVEELYLRVRNTMAQIGRYRYEHIFIDNSSTDNTVAVLKRIAAADSNVKIIVNARNFGHIRSPLHALYQATGDAIIGIVADLEDPPELIAEMVREWEKGNSMVLGIRTTREENPLMLWVRRRYYRLINQVSEIETFESFSGFGLYERRVIDLVKSFDDPYPYFRGLIAEIGLPHAKFYYGQPKRKSGVSKNNLYTLYDMAMLGITNFSKVPLRLVTLSGFLSSAICALVALGYLVYKILYWNRFSVGMAPLVIGIFFFSSIQLISVGLIGEYTGAIHTRVHKRPLVVERERVNFEHQPGMAAVSLLNESDSRDGHPEEMSASGTLRDR